MALSDLLFGDDTLDSTQGGTSDKNLTEKKIETTSGTQDRNSTTNNAEVTKGSQQQNTSQNSTTNVTGTTGQNQQTTGSQTGVQNQRTTANQSGSEAQSGRENQSTTERQTTLDVQTQNLLKGLLANIAGSPVPGTGSFNAVAPIISQLLGQSNTAITEEAKAQQALAQLDFSENTLPQLSMFAQDVGSTENSASQLLKTKALTDLATKLTAITADASVKERTLRSNELLQLLASGTQLGSAESQAGLANTQQASLISSILKGADVTQTSATNKTFDINKLIASNTVSDTDQTSTMSTIQDLINNLTQQQGTTQTSNIGTTAINQSDSTQSQTLNDKTTANQTTGSLASIIEALNQTQSGTTQKADDGLVGSIARLLDAVNPG